MAAIITISTRVHVDELARQARARVLKDGRAVLAAGGGNRRQQAHLRRLVRRLSDGGDLECLAGTGESSDVTYLMVRRVGDASPITWRGDAKTG